MRTVLTGCTVIDGTGNPPQDRQTVIVVDGRIAELRPGDYPRRAGSGERVIDLEGGYLLPGLWDVHAHLGDLLPDPKSLLTTESSIDYAIRAGRNAMDALRAGFTGLRVVGEDHYADLAWKKAFADRVFAGPRLFVCGRSMCITGGHGHGTLGTVEVDGPDAMRHAVREQLKHGADQIKLMVTGGVMTAGEGMQESQFLQDEIQAATDVAHLKGKRVCVHAWGTAGVKAAIRGGVDCIEHGLLDDEAVAMMIERGLFYVPTLNTTQDEKHIFESGMPDFMVEKALGSARAHLEGFRKALRAGVKIACGSDTNPISDFAVREIEHLVKGGMSELDALGAATRVSADLCGVLDQVGTVEPGKLGDLIALAASPLENISNIRHVKWVLKEGCLVDTSSPETIGDFKELFF